MRRMLIWAAGFLAVSCGTQRKALDTEIRDSTRVVVRTARVETIDTVYVELPRQVERIVTQDTTSRLENDYAVSEARVEAGMLHHTLKTKSAKIPVPVKSTIEKKDSVTTNSKSVVEKEKVYVEKELTAWQRFRLNGFWILAAIVAAIGFWKFRRPILGLFAKLIS